MSCLTYQTQACLNCVLLTSMLVSKENISKNNLNLLGTVLLPLTSDPVINEVVIEYDSRYILNIMYSSFSVVISTLLLLYTLMTIHLNELIL